jgi:hypothetical protein
LSNSPPHVPPTDSNAFAFIELKSEIADIKRSVYENFCELVEKTIDLIEVRESLVIQID